MPVLLLIIEILVSCLLTVIAAMGLVFFFRLRSPSVSIWGLKVFASALSTVFLFTGILSTLLGLLSGSVIIVLLGACVTGIYLFHFISVTQPPATESGFENAFGQDWSGSLTPGQKAHFLFSRRVLKLPVSSTPLVETDVTFAVIPDTGQELLCDIWQPTVNSNRSGLALIYMHGGAFYVLDKNFSTSAFFKHLTNQGHVIMDIAYRMAPEVGLEDMITDVKRAIAWMKAKADKYNVDPDKIILTGPSSGGYLAMMAAYTSNIAFIPSELTHLDFSCLGVVAESPSFDLEALYYRTEKQSKAGEHSGRSGNNTYRKLPIWLKKKFGADLHRLRMDRNIENIGKIAPLIGGSPEECPEVYKLFSPSTYVKAGCPPTLLIHGSHDMMAPVESTRRLFEELTRAGVPTVMQIVRQSDHSFTRFLPDIAPAAISVVYDIERFLAVLSGKKIIRNLP